MPVVDNAIYIDGCRQVQPHSMDHTFEELRACPGDGHSFCWIGLLRPDPDEVDAVAREFHLHKLAVEDTVQAHQRPKLEFYDDILFVVLRPVRYVDPTEAIEIGELHLFLGPDFVITVRHAEEPDLRPVRRRLEQDPDLLRNGPFSVLYAVFDKVVDDYAPVLDGLQTDIDEIEEQVFAGDPNASKRIYHLTREVITFQRAVEPLPALCAEVRNHLKARARESDLELRRALGDVADHSTRAVERTQSFRELLGDILAVDAALVAQKQSAELTAMTEASYDQGEQIKRISSWAAILFAPSLIATIYGMNFAHMPQLHWILGYPLALLVMVLLGLGLYGLFTRSGWI